MKHPQDLPAGAFPFLPGESARLPNVDPWVVWGDRRDIPPWIIISLELLRDGANPKAAPPPEWMRAVEANDSFCGAMRSVADEQLGLSSVIHDERDRADTITRSCITWMNKRTHRPIEDGKVWPLVWAAYSDALLADLAAYDEDPHAALERLDRHWSQYQSRRQAAFLAEFMDRDVWSPAMASAWFMFGGRPELVARYFNCGAEMQVCGIALLSMGSTVEGTLVEQITDPQPANSLLSAMRRSISNPTRVIAKGLLEGRGLMIEISPADMSRLVWDVNSDTANLLIRDDWKATNRTTVFAGVEIDRESLFRAVPRCDQPSAPKENAHVRQAPERPRPARRAGGAPPRAQQAIKRYIDSQAAAGRPLATLTNEEIATAANVSEDSVTRYRQTAG